MDESPAPGTEIEWASAWAAALDELELSLDEAERLLRGEDPGRDSGQGPDRTSGRGAPWTPPVLEGPMPVDLRTRALALHHRQQQVIRASAEAASALRRRAALTSRMSIAPDEPAPVYLDVTA